MARRVEIIKRAIIDRRSLFCRIRYDVPIPTYNIIDCVQMYNVMYGILKYYRRDNV